MNIALVSIRFDRKGGSERRTYQLASGLISSGHDVEIFAARVEDMDLDARVNTVPVSSGPSFMKIASFIKNVGRMLEGRPDIDIVHNQIRPFTDGVVTVGGGCHAEYLELSGRRFAFLNPLHRTILNLERERYRYGGCRGVITNSKLAKKGILKHYDYPEERVFVAYNGVDSRKFHPEGSAYRREELRAKLGLGDGPVALFLGSGFERKGLGTAMRALAKLNGGAPGGGIWKLLVAGGDDPGPYRKLAGKLGVSDSVVFAGPVSSPEHYYGASDIFVLPTLYDPFSNAALEAMACGLPVITTRRNGVCEVITDGESGFIMAGPDDHTALADIIAGLRDKDRRLEVGALARRIAEGLTWENTTRTTIKVYESAYA